MSFRSLIRRAASILLVPITRRYLKKPRQYDYHGISLVIPPGVFHPGLFSSTGFLLDYVSKQTLVGTSFLELGCGSGLISIIAAHKGARVVASDLSTTAVDHLRLSAANNRATLQIVQSDLFDSIPPQSFDWIVINPPYYPRDPVSEADLAWYCGNDFQYFNRLFSTLQAFIVPTTKVLLVLSEDCDLERIRSLALANGFHFEQIAARHTLLGEENYLFLVKAWN